MRRTLPRLALALATLGACGKPPPRDAEATTVATELPPAPPPEVEFAGCQATRREPLTCWLSGPRTRVNLWVPARRVPLVAIDGAPAKALLRPSTGDPGWTIELELPSDARTLSVRLDDDGAAWTLSLEPTAPTPRLDAIEATLPPENAPDRAAFERALQALDREAANMSTYERIAASRARMLLLYKAEKPSQAVDVGFRAVDEALRDGRAGEAIAIAEVLVFFLSQMGDTTGVELMLDLGGNYLPLVADATQQLRWHYYRGMQAQATGDLRAALEELEAAERAARRLGLRNDELAAASLRAPLLGWLGRHSERAALIDRILVLTTESPPEERCRSANFLNSAGWAVLLARAHYSGPDNAQQLFERARAFYSDGGGCAVGDDPVWRRNAQEVQINLALEAIVSGDWERATVREREIDESALQSGQTRWLRYIQGELALHRGDFPAVLFATAALDGDEDPLLAWQSVVLRSRALQRMGREDDALEGYRKAEERLDQVVKKLGIDQGREGLTAGMHSSATYAIELLLKRDDRAAAAEVARRSRSRALRPVGRGAAMASLSPKDRARCEVELATYEELARTSARELTGLWRLPEDARDESLRRLAARRSEMRVHLDAAYDILGRASADAMPRSTPARGEVWLLYHPLPAGWVGFAITDSGIASAELEVPIAGAAPEIMSERLLVPFRQLIDAAERVDVLAMDDLDPVSFHALPWHGAPLIDAKTVAYRLDIGEPTRDEQPDRGAALVVADPSSVAMELGGLVSARAEGDEVAHRLRARGWQVELLTGDSASYDRVVGGMKRVDWLHFAGHGLSSGGWESALPLAGEASLGLREIMALPRVPNAVVLSGCRTGAVDEAAAAGGQHLAGAFLLAGAGFVIATSADVPDSEAAIVAKALYDELGESTGETGPELLRRASRRVAETPDVTAWRHYRAWVP